MADQDETGEFLRISTLIGPLNVSPSDDGRFAIFTFGNPEGANRVAVRNEDLPRLIATCAHAYTPQMRRSGDEGPGPALPTNDWAITEARDGAVAFSFELVPGAALTMLVPATQKAGLLQALQSALGMDEPQSGIVPPSFN
ncbi:MAG TPA: hypothetical protein VFE13_16525 [Caulobacteraceae bacterium]|jgi:hypothetical protein|nr:hypothetical protein [Caulobacteraceae bacterium]